MDAINSVAALHWATYGSLVIGALYFAMTRPSHRIARRIAASVYAPLSALLFMLAVWLPPTLCPREFPRFWCLQLLAAARSAISLRVFDGPRRVHAVLAPVKLACAVWQAGLGHVLVAGK